jgi:hypothetical protein
VYKSENQSAQNECALSIRLRSPIYPNKSHETGSADFPLYVRCPLIGRNFLTPLLVKEPLPYIFLQYANPISAKLSKKKKKKKEEGKKKKRKDKKRKKKEEEQERKEKEEKKEEEQEREETEEKERMEKEEKKKEEEEEKKKEEE